MLPPIAERQLTGLDHLLVSADRALRTLTGDTRPALRATPALQVAECSLTKEETARSIDSEIRSIVEAARSRALGYLTEHKATLERIATRLLLVETLDREELENIVNGNPAPAKEISP